MGGMEEKMLQNIILLFLEKICEAIYFSLFLIYGKNLKEKRLLFIGIMIFEYLMLKCFIKFNVYFQIAYTFMSFINLKVLYREKAQITDIFLFATASIFLIVISFCSGLLHILKMKYFYALIINRIILFSFLFFIKNKINLIYKKYYLKWNRKDNMTKIRSLTLRNISVIIFNLMFYVINIGLIYAILTKR